MTEPVKNEKVYPVNNNRHLWANFPCPVCKAEVGYECTLGFPAFHNDRVTLYYKSIEKQLDEISKEAL